MNHLSKLSVLSAVFGLLLAIYAVNGYIAHAQPAPGDAPAAATAVIDAGPTAAPAPAVASPDDVDPVDTATKVVRDVRAGSWRYALAGILSLLMFALSKARGLVPWFKGDRGGSVLVMLLALLGAFATALASSEPVTWRLLAGAAGVAWTAVGGYTWFKRLLKPADKG